MFVGYTEEDSDFEGDPLPSFAVYGGSSNLTQATLEAVPWDVWVSIGKAAWPDQELRYLTLRLNKHFLTICDDKRFCEALRKPFNKKYTIVRKNKLVLRKFVRHFKKHIISKAYEYEYSDADADVSNSDEYEGTEYDSDDVYMKGPAGYDRYTPQFNKALRRFWMIKEKLEKIQEFEDDLVTRWDHEGRRYVGGEPFYVPYKAAIHNQDWASFKVLARKFFNKLQYHQDYARPHYRALNLKWAKNINVFTKKRGHWWCVQ